MKIPELLAPAGNPEKLRMAVLYGADAVYLGGRSFGLRAFGGNFTPDKMKEAVAFAHQHGTKVYITINIFPHDNDMLDLDDYLYFVYDIGADAALVADLGVFTRAREIVPSLPLHVSTQANNTNWRAAEAWHKLGAKRIVLARELSGKEISEIRRHTDAELEIFVHGAMCISYSGRCMLSNYLAGRDANRGACAQPCRWKYALVEEKCPGEYLPIEEDEHGTYIMNSKDLCLLPYLQDVIDTGVDSLKIEGRMKSVHYVASVTKAYRDALDGYAANGGKYESSAEEAELQKVSHREYTTGFFFGRPDGQAQNYKSSEYIQTSEFIGIVRSYDAGYAKIEQRNHMEKGEEIEVFSPEGTWKQRIDEMIDAQTSMPIDVAPHAQQMILMKMERPVSPYTILRRDK
ncbi:MAG: U32 family peptidase [Veillonellaceae bacterium]|nr:U32 family peptidase [Veillonellaceae bacterium]